MKTLIQNIGLLATPEGFCARRGPAQGQLRLLKNAWVLAEDGIIAAVGQGAPPCGAEQVIDAEGRLATPGLADAHTHLIFGGWRQDELADKLHGVPYLDILARGGGILSTVRATRAATEAELLEKGRRALLEMQRFGVTACEAKSGYGLETETELRQLRVIRQLGQECAMDLAPTFLGAHALPPEYQNDREGYLRLLCEEMIPRAAAEGLARFCDVFCEEGVFTAEESRRILLAGKAHGLLPKLHADEIHPIGGSQLAGELGAVSAEHLIVCPEEGMDSMARSGVIACLLPCTSLYLGEVRSGPAAGGKGRGRCHRHGFQPRLLPLPEPAAGHESGLSVLPAHAGGGPHRRYPQRRGGHGAGRPAGLGGAGQAVRPGPLGRAGPELSLLPDGQQPLRIRH